MTVQISIKAAKQLQITAYKFEMCSLPIQINSGNCNITSGGKKEQ
jgi:hypothetical protein